MSKLGLRPIGNFNAGNLLGFAQFSATIDPATETRSSSETSFLQAAVNESEHVVVYNNIIAERILFNANSTATGVLVSTAAREYTLTARNEIIVADGVLRKPLNQTRYARNLAK